MKSDLVELSLLFMILTLGGGLEEILPKFLGVGFPILLSAVQFVAARGRSTFFAMALAMAAGAMEDALSSLPVLTGVGYFMLTAALVRWARLPMGAAALTYPLFQMWLWLWTGSLEGGIFGRLLIALPLGVATELLTWATLDFTERKAAIDGRT